MISLFFFTIGYQTQRHAWRRVAVFTKKAIFLQENGLLRFLGAIRYLSSHCWSTVPFAV